MMTMLRRRGRPAEITLPSMDGPFKPNTALDDGVVRARLTSPDCLTLVGTRLVASGGPDLYEILPDKAPVPIRTFDATITALAGRPDGTLAIALDDGRILLRDHPNDRAIGALAGPALRSPTALLFDEQALIVAEGSSERRASDWARDLLLRGATGSVWRCRLDTGERVRLAEGLAYPNGLLIARDGSLVVAEAWRHRLVRLASLEAPAALSVVVADLPGYPARLAPGADGGAWLAIFAPRCQAVEYVLEQREFCARMVEQIADPDAWLAPSLRSGVSMREPLTGGAVRQMGRLKPWAPSRSYGLVVRLDGALQPHESLHSRADGARHGTTCCLERDGELLVACKGDDVIVGIATSRSGGGHAQAA